MYNGSTIGQVEDGFDCDEPGLGQIDPITGDNYGPGCVQDGVTQGGNVFCRFTLTEYDATSVRLMLSPGGVAVGAIVQPGLLISSLAKAFVLTKVSGTNAVPTSRTATYAILSNQDQVRYALGNKKRFIPVVLRFLPYSNGGVRTFFVDT